MGNHDLQSTFTCSVSDGLRNLVGLLMRRGIL